MAARSKLMFFLVVVVASASMVGLGAGASQAATPVKQHNAAPAAPPRFWKPVITQRSGEGFVKLRWTKGAKSTTPGLGWSVHVNGDILMDVEVTKPRFTLTLGPGETAYVAVSPHGRAPSNLWSDAVIVRSSPSAPSGVTVTSVTRDSADVTWSDSVGASSYAVYLNGNLWVTSDTTHALLAGLANDTSYQLTVVARDGERTSSPSPSQTFRTATGVPLPPSSVTVSNVTGTGATVRWSAVPDAEWYKVYVNDVATTVDGTTLSQTVTGLLYGQTYVVRVFSYAFGTESATAATTSFETLAPVPVRPVVLSVTTGSVLVGWTPVPNAMGYEILLNGASLVPLTSSSPYSVNSLAAGTSYTVGIRAIYPGGGTSAVVTLPVVTLGDRYQAPLNSILPSVNAMPWTNPVPGITLTGQSGMWISASPLTLAYRWQRSLDGIHYVDIASATNGTYTVREQDLDYYLRFRVVATNGNGQTVENSATAGQVAAVAPAEPPTAQGKSVVGQALTLRELTWSSTPRPTVRLLWQTSSDGLSWADDVMGISYVLGDGNFGGYVRVEVTATSALGSATYYTTPRGPIAAALNTVPPVVSGSMTQGRTLTTSTGTWLPANVSVTYAWQRSFDQGATWSTIANATSATYTTTADDGGAYLRSAVSGTAAVPSSSAITAWSAPVGPVVAVARLTCISQPVITGIPRVGTRLSASTGTWTGGASPTFEYLWQKSTDGSTWSSAGSTTSAYTPVAGDIGSYLRVRVTATSGAASGSTVSYVTGKVNAPAALTAPAITGTPRVAATLTASTGTWAGDANTPSSYTYQWQYSVDGMVWDDTAVYTATITPAGTLGGLYLRVVVTAINANGSQQSASAATAATLPPLPSVDPVVSGDPTVSQVLTSTAGEWSGANVDEVYQWQSSADGSTWTDISSATSATYTLTTDETARYVRCRVSVVFTSGSSSAYSSPVGPVHP